jgi:hypothetical protein
MATSPNFNWPEPDNTDLVKNGALAIRTAVDAIDSSMADLKGGTTNQVLTKASNTDMDFSWATVSAGGGKVLQIVYASYATEVVNSTSTYADTGLTATITPSSATSKVLVLVTQNGVGKQAGNASSGCNVRLSLPGGSTIQFGYAVGYDGTSIERFHGSVSYDYLHSPATTSAITYKTQFANFANASSVTVQNDNNASSSIVLLEIGA